MLSIGFLGLPAGIFFIDEKVLPRTGFSQFGFKSYEGINADENQQSQGIINVYSKLIYVEKLLIIILVK